MSDSCLTDEPVSDPPGRTGNRWPILLVIPVAAVALGSCSGVLTEDESSPTESAALVAPAPLNTTTTLSELEIEDLLFVTLVEAELPNLSLAEARSISRQICSDLRSGVTVGDLQLGIAVAAIEEGWSDDALENVGFLIGLGVERYCPEFSYQLDGGSPSGTSPPPVPDPSPISEPPAAIPPPPEPSELVDDEPSAEVRGEDSIKFGFLSGLSGDFGSWGPPSLDGARAAIGQINANGGVLGRQVELVVEDNRSTAEGSVAGYNRIREDIHALGGIESIGAVALLDAIAEDKMPTMCPACGSTELDTTGGNYLWRITASDTTYAIVAAQIARDLGYTRVALLVQQGEWGQEARAAAANAFKEVWENSIGGEITANVRFAPGRDSYSTELQQALEGNPDALFLIVGYLEGVPIIQDYIKGGYEATILPWPYLGIPGIAEAAAELPTGQVLSAQVTDDFDSPAYAAFAAAHFEHTDKPPPIGFYETNQYDQYIALALAMTAAGSTDGPAVAAQVPQVLNPPGAKVYNYADGVAALKRGADIDYDGPSGSLQLNRYGNLISLKVAVQHIANGQYTVREVIELDATLSP